MLFRAHGSATRRSSTLYRLGVTKDERNRLLNEWANQCDGTVKVYERADVRPLFAPDLRHA
jgi:hypothetical protein